MTEMKMQDRKKKNPLTPKMKHFAELYHDTRTAVTSYASAYGYDISSDEGRRKHYQACASSGHNLLKDERIQEYLEKRELETDFERELTDKELVMVLNKIVLSGHYKENTKMDAIKMLARMRGMYDEVETEQQININLSNELEEMIKKREDVTE